MSSALFVTTVPITLEVFLAPFADHFRSEGWRVDALANGAVADDGLADHFDARYNVDWSRNPLAPSNVLGTSRRVREVVSAGNYDVVHVHTPIAAFVTRRALRARRPGRPVVIYTAHGFHFYYGGHPLKNTVFRTMERIAAPWTDYLVTINEEDFRAARAMRGIAQDRVRLIPGIGVDVERFAEDSVTAAEVEAVRRELDVAQTAFMLTMVAEFAPVKRHTQVLDALAKVEDPRVVLVLVGDGPLEAQVRGRATELGLDRRVRWAGYRRDIPAILAASDACILASEREGLNRSVLEAMAAGRPVIGTDTRGIADAVGDTGWIVPKHDSSALAAAIDHAAADPDEVVRRGQRARARVGERFALPGIVNAYEELYREALASRI